MRLLEHGEHDRRNTAVLVAALLAANMSGCVESSQAGSSPDAEARAIAANERDAELGTEVIVTTDGKDNVLEGPLSPASTGDGHGEWKTVCVHDGDKDYCIEKPRGGRLLVMKSGGTRAPSVPGALIGVGVLVVLPIVIGTVLFLAGGSTGR